MIVIETLHHFNLFVDDLEKSVAFYTLLLDFETVEQTDEYVDIVFDNIRLRLNKTEGQAFNPDQPAISFNMDIDDFTDAIAELEEANIPIVEGPDAIEGGEKLIIADPSGNKMELFYKE